MANTSHFFLGLESPRNYVFWFLHNLLFLSLSLCTQTHAHTYVSCIIYNIHIISPFKCSEGPFPLSLFTSHSIFLEETKYFFLLIGCFRPLKELRNLKKYQFLLEYSCFTELYLFLLYSKVNPLYVYIYPPFLNFLPI